MRHEIVLNQGKRGQAQLEIRVNETLPLAASLAAIKINFGYISQY